MDLKLVMSLMCLLGAIPASGAGIVPFRNAYQSSTDDFPRTTAQKAMDGNQGTVARTQSPSDWSSWSSWWVGQLEKTTSIGKILIYTPLYAVGYFRRLKVEVRTSENEPWRVCKPLHKLEMQSPSTGVVRCDGGPMTAKEVRLTVQDEKLFLAEVEVFEAGSEKPLCTFLPGDGVGRREEKIGMQTGNDCVRACLKMKESDSNVNGVTLLSSDNPGCWCEIGMSKRKSSATYKSCFLNNGKVDGGWGGWGSYGKCKILGSKPCGNGFEKRTRACNKPSPANGGKPCTGVSESSRRCKRSCPSKPKPNPSNPGTNAPSVPGTYQISTEPWGFGEKAQLRCVEDANEYRRRHQDTPDFKLDATLAADAQRYADKMANGAPFAHPVAELTQKRQGENLAAYSRIFFVARQDFGPADLHYCQYANKWWWDEIRRFDFTPSAGGPPRYFDSCWKIYAGDLFRGPADGKGVGHFFQIAWDSVQKVGFGVAYGRDKMFVVARYSPQRGPGLTAGEHIHPLKTTPNWQQWYKKISGNEPCVLRGDEKSGKQPVN